MSILSPRLALAAVLVASALVIALPAGRAPVWDQNEARYMLLARDILERGRWLIPDLRGDPHLNKPQLFFWSVALASMAGGEVTERTAALPGVLSAVATVAAVLAIATRAWGWQAGALAALALTTTLGFFAVAHHGQSDLMVAAWSTWALYCLLGARRSGWRLGPVLGFWVCVAGATMSKGPVGLAALGAGLISVAATHGWRSLGRLRPVIGLAVLALLLTPWWVTFLIAHRAGFAEIVVGEYGVWVFRRGLLTRLESLWVLAYFLPWTLFLAAAVVWWRCAAPDAERRAVGWWALAMGAMIGLSGIHRVRYLVPIYPGLALLVAEFIARARDDRGIALLRRATFGFVALALIVAGLGLTPLLDQIGSEGRPWVPDTLGERSLAVAVLLGSALAAIAVLRHRAFAAVGLAVALGVGGVLVIEGVRYPGRFARDFDVRPLTTAARRLTPPGAAVAAYPDIPLTYDFYLRVPVVELSDDAVARLVADPPRGALIASPRGWGRLAPHAHAAWQIVATQRLGGKPMLVLGHDGARPPSRAP
jgi:4-amino-4-deoxy-L-arabinose transferase-like glycosyltransferase